jgi:hypothetical protein
MGKETTTAARLRKIEAQTVRRMLRRAGVLRASRRSEREVGVVNSCRLVVWQYLHELVGQLDAFARASDARVLHNKHLAAVMRLRGTPMVGLPA